MESENETRIYLSFMYSPLRLGINKLSLKTKNNFHVRNIIDKTRSCSTSKTGHYHELLWLILLLCRLFEGVKLPSNVHLGFEFFEYFLTFWEPHFDLSD